MGRALLKSKDEGDPSEDYPGIFGWVKPVSQISDGKIVRTVGLDAVVLLDFMKTSFYFFSICAGAAILVLVPVNLTRNGSTDDDLPEPGNNDTSGDNYLWTSSSHLVTLQRNNGTSPARKNPTLSDLVIDPQTTIGLHLLFVYFFSILALYMLHKNFHRFLARRQTFALARKNSVPARTVLVSAIPESLRSEEKLRDHFEKACGWKVEAIRMVKNVGSELREALHEREQAMRGLEKVWWKYRGSKGLGHIRLPEQDEDEDNERPVAEDAVDEEGRPAFATPSRSSSKSGKARRPLKTPEIGLALSEEPNWGEVRREHDLPTGSVPPAFLAAGELEGGESSEPSSSGDGSGSNGNGNFGARPIKRVPRSTLQKAIPLLGEKVDAIDYWQDKFDAADAKVEALRKVHGNLSGSATPGEPVEAIEEPTDAETLLGGHKAWHTTEEGFVTFENIRDAEFASQVVHFPEHSECTTSLAPDPEDIVWQNMGMPNREHIIRSIIVAGIMIGGLLTWVIPVSALASLLSFQEIRKVAPWLADLIEKSPLIAALVQTTLPSTSVLIFNAALPYLLEWLCYMQGFRSKSAISTSILKKYTLFLIVTVLFVFLVFSTVLDLVLELAGSPEKIPRRLAQEFTKNKARAFSTSYVMLSGLGIMPLQLLNIGQLFFIAIYRIFFTLTPREYTELYTPAAINYGMVYPPAIMVFMLTLLYSVISPLILIFGAIYFGMGYLVYKYKLIYVFVNPYESSGDAWPTTFARLIWGVVLLQVFMTGLFAARQSVIASTGMIPLLLGTVAWSWTMREDFRGLSQHTPLASIAAADQAEASVDHPISIRYGRLRGSAVYSQSELVESLPKPWIMN